MNAILIDTSSSTSAPTRWREYNRVRASGVSAQSDAGKISNDLWDGIQRKKIETLTTPPDNVRLERELADIQHECSVADWDGYGAKPLNRYSVEYVWQFLTKLPYAEISYPELCAEPTGDLTMVWRKRGYHLVVGINGAKQIAWGGTSPTGHIYGDAMFDSEIPEDLIHLLHSVDGLR
jgi:hypothetical protein